jgi:hypothetical protein
MARDMSNSMLKVSCGKKLIEMDILGSVKGEWRKGSCVSVFASSNCNNFQLEKNSLLSY